MSLIALGVTGGIGAYKAVEVARGLQKHGHDVTAVMTRSARQFVGEVTFEAITRRRVITDQWTPGANADIEHIALATEARLLLVTPATANIIGKFANGIADDFLSSLYLATTAPVLMAPAMNTHMLAHPAVMANVETLRARGVQFVEPGQGFLACGWVGKGRLAEPEAIVDAAVRVLGGEGGNGGLTGTRVIVTAGPTCEDVDPVRYVGNRSSGRMGYAIAAALARRGAAVVLISGPSALDPPAVHELVRVRTAAEMHRAVLEAAPAADALVMAAAVADFRPVDAADQKIKKESGGVPRIVLEPTADVLRATRDARPAGCVVVGFALETMDAVENGRRKLEGKGLDLLVVNDATEAGAGFEVETNRVVLLQPGRDDEALPLLRKDEVADRILDRVEALLPAKARA